MGSYQVHAGVPPPGIYVPVPTFFKQASQFRIQAELDIPTQVSHSVYLAKTGIHGLVLLGSTGEAIHLSRSERKALISGVRAGLNDAGFPKYPIMAGVLTNSVEDTLEWLEDVRAAGADWGLVLVPGYFGTIVDQANIEEWYQLVADRSPMPILIYNYPGVTNNIMVAPETYARLAEHENIVGCKMSHGNVSHHVQVSLHPKIEHFKFRVFSGFGQQLFPIVISGGAGVIDGLAAFYPYSVIKLFELSTTLPIDKKSLGTIHRIQFAVSSAEEMVGKFGIVGIKEAIFRVLNMGTLEGGRLPLKGSMPKGEWEKWSEVLQRMEQLEKEFGCSNQQ